MAAAIEYALELDNKQFKRGAAGAENSMSSLGSSIGGLAKVGGLAALAGAIAGVGAATAAAAKGVGLAMSMETATTQFGILLGSADAAQQRIAELRDFASATPFQFPEIANASKTLETLTKGALSTGKGLTMVGDVAAMTGQPFSDTAVTVGRLFDALDSGQAAGQSLSRLQELGAISGDTRAQIEQLQKEGKKGPEVWAVAEEALGKFGGAMDAQSKTMAGMLSTLKDGVDNIFIAFGQPVMDMLKPYLADVVAFASQIPPLIEAGVEMIQSTVEQGRLGELTATSLKWAFGVAANYGVGAFQFLADVAGRLLNFQFKQVVDLFRGNFNGVFSNVFGGLKDILDGVGSLILAKLGSPFQVIVAKFQAGLQKGIFSIMQGLGWLQEKMGGVLGDGLIGFEAPSYEKLLEDTLADNDADALQRRGNAKIDEGLDRIMTGLNEYGQISGSNLAEAMEGVSFEVANLFDTDELKSRIGDLAKDIDKEAYDKFMAAIDALGDAGNRVKAAAKQVESAAKGAASVAEAVAQVGAPLGGRSQRDVASLGQRFIQMDGGSRERSGGLAGFLNQRFNRSQLAGSGVGVMQAQQMIEGALAQGREVRTAGGTAREAKEAFNAALRGAQEDLAKPATEATAKAQLAEATRAADALDELAVA